MNGHGRNPNNKGICGSAEGLWGTTQLPAKRMIFGGYVQEQMSNECCSGYLAHCIQQGLATPCIGSLHCWHGPRSQQAGFSVYQSRHQALVNLCGCTQLHLVCVDILLLHAGRSLDIIPSFLGGHHHGGEILVIWDGSFHHFWR